MLVPNWGLTYTSLSPSQNPQLGQKTRKNQNHFNLLGDVVLFLKKLNNQEIIGIYIEQYKLYFFFKWKLNFLSFTS